MTIETSIIEKSKAYAKHTGRSLSELVENYLEFVTRENHNSELSTNLRKIVGSVTISDDCNDEKMLRAAMEKKHFK